MLGCLAKKCFLGGSYALIATATDYDSWRPHSASVTVDDVMTTLSTNAATSRLVVATILHELHAAIEQGLLDEEKGIMRSSILPCVHPLREEDAKKLAFVLPEYFSVVDHKSAGN